jgi:RNA polymerase sigma factor (sigma-70 family)
VEVPVLDEVALVRGLKSGDDRARVEFWRVFWDVAYPICARMLGGGAEATDTAVDLLTDFMTHFVHQLQEPRALRTYVRLMAVRRSQEVVRRRKKSVRLGFDPMDEAGATPEEMAHWHALKPYLDGCLEKLTPKARQALRLKYGQKLSNAEIGRMLGGSKQYVSRLVIECLGVLRQCIESAAKREKEEKR